MFIQITQSLSASIREISMAEIKNQWAQFNIDEVLQQMKKLSALTNVQEKSLMGDQIVGQLQIMEKQINIYLNECQGYSSSAELQEKVQQLKNQKNKCGWSYDNEFQGSTRLPPGRSDQPESSDPQHDTQSVHQQAANQDKPFQSNPNYEGNQKENKQQSTRLPPGRSDQPESTDPKHDTQSVHQQAANQDQPYQANPNYEGSQKENKQQSTRLPPGRSDQLESSDPKHDTQSVHQQAANQDKPFQSNPNYEGSQKENKQQSTRLPPGRSDQPESSNPQHDTQSVHQQAANQDKPFQSNPNYEGSQKENKQQSTRLPPGRSDQPESSDPKHDTQSVHQQAANQDKPFQSNPNYEGSQKENKYSSCTKSIMKVQYKLYFIISICILFIQIWFLMASLSQKSFYQIFIFPFKFLNYINFREDFSIVYLNKYISQYFILINRLTNIYVQFFSIILFVIYQKQLTKLDFQKS